MESTREQAESPGTTLDWSALEWALLEVWPHATWTTLTTQVAELAATRVRAENRAAAEEVVALLRTGTSPATWPRDVSRSAQEVLAQRDDPMMRAVRGAVNGNGLVHLAAHTPKRELVDQLVRKVSRCPRTCAGRELAVTLALRGDLNVASALRAGRTLCSVEAENEGFAGDHPAYLTYLKEAARNGMTEFEGFRARAAAEVVLEAQETSAQVLETYYQLVLDGTNPEQAMEIAATLS